MQQFEKVRAYFEPKKVETLQEGVESFIGKIMIFEALWVIEEGVYADQWAMRPCGIDGILLPFGWVPEEDIRVITIQDTKG